MSTITTKTATWDTGPFCQQHQVYHGARASETLTCWRKHDAGLDERGDLPVIASHTALLDVLDAAKLLLAMNNCNYDRDQMRRSGGFDQLQTAVDAVETLRQAREEL